MTTETKPRTNSVLAVVIDEATRSIVFNVQGASATGGSKSLTFYADRVHPDNAAYAALHGFNQRLRDAAAQSRNPITGAPATPADKFAAIERLVAHYHSGSPEWNLRSPSGERTGGELAMLVAAVAEAKSADPAKVRAFLESKSAAERRAIAVSKLVKPIMDRMRAELAAPVDADAMLDELEIE